MADYDVVGLKLYREGENTIAEIMTSGPTNVKTATLENPDRLLIDLIGGIHRLKTEGLLALPPGIVVEVRSAQNQAKPTPITRIVLTLAEPVGEISSEDGPRAGKVIIPTPGYPEFEPWSIGRETPAKEPEEAPEAVTTDTTTPAKPPAEEKSSPPATTEVVDTTAMDTSGVEVVTTTDSSLAPGTAFIRRMVKYDGEDFRDPFVVAKAVSEARFGEEALPSADVLELVGIVKGQYDELLAVLQDNRGWGYIMGVSDSVKDGIVGEVTDSTVRFDITEFGITRPIIMGLSKEE